jgi:undecaprenyl-diphosphatase
VLGIVQGLTEFIPVSSSGHLILFDKLFGGHFSSLTFDVALHIGTLAALLVVFWRDILDLLKPANRHMLNLIIIAIFPAVIAGVLLQDLAEDSFRSVNLVAFNLIAVALIMLYVDRRASLKLKLEQLSGGKALLIGLAQAAALFPGVSRSGSTITAGLATGLDRVAATRFSFLLSAPVIAGAILKVMLGDGLHQAAAEPAVYLVGILASFVSGVVAIKFLLGYLSRRGLEVFAWYRIGLGVILLLIGAINA